MIRYTMRTILAICFFFSSINGTDIIKGDADAPVGTSFSFPIQAMVMSNSATLYTGAHIPLTKNQEYALSRFTRGTGVFVPIAPETVVVNNVVDQPNPLYGAQINSLSILRPLRSSTDIVLATSASDPAKIYLVDKVFTPQQITLVETAPANDALGNSASTIVNQTTNSITHAFATVNPANGLFGNMGSGIALFAFGDLNNTTVFGQVDVTNGSIVAPKAAALDKSSSVVTMNGSALSVMANSTALHWDESLKRLFIGLDVTSGNGTNDAALAVVVAKLTEKGGFELMQIAPNSAFIQGDTDTIIGIRNGAAATNQRIAISAISSLYTSTKMNYLIVVGNVATATTTPGQSVFALPLVSNGDAVGTIADKNAEPENIFSADSVPKFIGRVVNSPALNSTDMTQATDLSAQVGGGILPAGAITKLFVRDDTVFVTVGNDKNIPDGSGVYFSQALCNAAGTIIGWTQWQRAVGTVDNVFNAALNAFDGTTLFASGNDVNTVSTIAQTTWSDGNSEGLLPVTTFLNSVFNLANGGIQSLATYLPSAPGIADIAVMIAGGIGKLVLVQTGMDDGGIIIPTQADEYIIQSYENGTIDSLVNAKIIEFSGGALDSIGPITASTFGQNAADGWLFVGGSHGLAMLSNPDGSGWNVGQNELSDTFDGLQPGMSFKIVGNYTFVKKLISDDNFLYIITNTIIDKINLSTTDFGTNTIDVTTIATIDNIPLITSTGAFLDAIMSQASAFIATTSGLIRIGDNKDVRTITDSADADWTPITIAEAAGSPTQLIAVTTSGRAEDITRSIGGNLYVLTSNEGYNQSRINRFAVTPLQPTQSMQPTTLEPFNDLFVKNIPSFFLNFSNFASIFTTNGALYFASRNKNSSIPPRVILTPAIPAPQVGIGGVGERSSIVTINKINNGTEINGFEYNQASGSLVIAGDFGIQVLE